MLTVFPYGAHLDQESEQNILYSNLKTYLHYFNGEATTLYQAFDSCGITGITDSIEKDHGMAVYYPLFGIFYINQVSPFIGNIVWHIYIYVLMFCGVYALFHLLLRIFHHLSVSVFATTLFFFTPRIFAESHYNNKDIVLLSLIICTAYYGWKVYEKRNWRDIICFSLFGSLSSNMKIIGIFIWGMLGLYILLALIIKRQFNKDVAIKGIACVFLWLSSYIIITPACWTGLWEFWYYLFSSASNFRWNDYILFMGHMYNKNSTGIPKIYLPTMISLTIPVGILLLAGIGSIIQITSLIRKPEKLFDGTGYLFVMELAVGIPLCYAILAETSVYNGWRHFYFTYIMFITLAAQCIFSLYRMASRFHKEKLISGILGIYSLSLIAGIAMSYPNEYAYYNILAGQNVASSYELDYWDMSFKQAYEILLQNCKEGNITVGTISNPAYWGLEKQLNALRGKHRMRFILCEDWKNAEYIIVNPTYANMYGSSEYSLVKENYLLMDSIKSYGNTICEIYQKQKTE